MAGGHLRQVLRTAPRANCSRAGVLLDLVDSLYRQKHGLTVTGNLTMLDLVEQERMHPAIVRRLDGMCRAVEL